MLDTRRSWLVGELSADDSGVERWRSLRKLEAARIAARRGAGHAEGAWGVEEWPRIDLLSLMPDSSITVPSYNSSETLGCAATRCWTGV
jgi:hypothetical protein